MRKVTLQNFRNYAKRSFDFSGGTTLIVGPNAVGKTNVLEAMEILATGKSFRAEAEKEVIREGQQVGRIVGETGDNELEIIWDDRERFQKLYKVNGVGKRQVDFVGNLRAVLFSPQDIEIATDSPSTRRRYLDSVLSQTSKEYRLAAHIYERALRQRNRLLWRIREEGVSRQQLSYWDELLINNGSIIHEHRKNYLEFLNGLKPAIFPVSLKYDHSVISQERLQKYAREEVAAAATLVGPHRDDFAIEKHHQQHEENVRSYGSRGEQRLAVFAIKLGELEYIKRMTSDSPVLLLDDIFSELDHVNRHHVLEVIPKQQTIMTTTDLHLVDKRLLKKVETIELG